MRPKLEPPPPDVAYEVGMIPRHLEVVNRRDFAVVLDVFDRQPAAVFQEELLARLQHPRRHPASALRIERVLSGRPQFLSADPQQHDRGHAGEDLCDFLLDEWRVRVELIQYVKPLVDFESLD